jgi:hypothetical protein
MAAMNHDATDPPMEPLAGTVSWLETGHEPLANDPDLAALIVRIGMATNLLTIQIRAAGAARTRATDAVRQRDNLCSLVTAASLTYEAK